MKAEKKSIGVLVVLKIVQSRVGGYASIGSFVILFLAYLPQIEAYVPIPIFIIVAACLMVLDYRYLFPVESDKTARKNPFNLMMKDLSLDIQERLERVEKKLDVGQRTTQT